MPVVIFGVGTLAKLAYYYITKDLNCEVVAFVVDREKNQNLDKSKLYDLPVYYWDQLIKKYPPNEIDIFIAVAYKNMRNRLELFQRIKSFSYKFINIISSSAFVSENTIQGTNNFIMPGVVLEPGSKIGSNNLIWSNSTICHDSIIGDHNFFGANVTMGGRSKVGDLCFFGFSSTITDNIKIEDEVLLAANSFLKDSVEKQTRMQGVPAKKYTNSEFKNGITF